MHYSQKATSESHAELKVFLPQPHTHFLMIHSNITATHEISQVPRQLFLCISHLSLNMRAKLPAHLILPYYINLKIKITVFGM